MPSSKAPWAVYAGPLVFLLPLIAIAIVFGACSGEPEPTPAPLPTATVAPVSRVPATPTTSLPPTSATEAPARTLGDLLASIERDVERIRGIDTPPPIEHLFVDQAGMRERIAEELSDPEVVEQIIHESALLKLLGVIPQDSDLGAIYESMLGGQVLGLYDPEKEQFFVLGDDSADAGPLNTEAQLTYAHEYVHRLQDSSFDLEAITERDSGGDMSIAVSALIEGDATTVQTQYMLREFDFGELSELLESVLAAQAELPPSPYFLQRSLEFPYVEGAVFVGELIAAGGFAAVDDAFENLPRSTEQVLHPEKYLDSEEPVELDVPVDAMGEGWSVQAASVLGEFFLKTWLEALGSASAPVAAAGWGGDAYAVFEDGSGGFALGVVIAWDTDIDAQQFFEVASDALDAHEDFSIASGGLPGILEAWWGPGGYVVMSRWDSGDSGDMIAIGITPTGGGSHGLVFALADQ